MTCHSLWKWKNILMTGWDYHFKKTLEKSKIIICDSHSFFLLFFWGFYFFRTLILSNFFRFLFLSALMISEYFFPTSFLRNFTKSCCTFSSRTVLGIFSASFIFSTSKFLHWWFSLFTSWSRNCTIFVLSSFFSFNNFFFCITFYFCSHPLSGISSKSGSLLTGFLLYFLLFAFLTLLRLSWIVTFCSKTKILIRSLRKILLFCCRRSNIFNILINFWRLLAMIPWQRTFLFFSN